MEQKSCHKRIYKIHSKFLKKNKWDLKLDLFVAMRLYPECIVSLNDSQILRFIDEINGVHDLNSKVKNLQNRIHRKKKSPSKEAKKEIRELYRELYTCQFQSDYVCVIMDSEKDYDRANLGFKINGISYRRLLGTNGGIKNSTIVYINEELYPVIKERIDNGRNKNIPLVPAKLESYQALVCSGSTPVPPPKGIIVVNDCITHFKEDVLLINDELDGEPDLSYVKDFDIEHNDSDGYGLMLPSYSRKINQYLTGTNCEIAGMNTRYAWTKGMVYTFDFVDFAEKVAGTYFVKDVWGHIRDVRDAEVILTESMLKLWNCYDSWENYYENCEKNHYEFSVTKTTPSKLENVRDTNYQFLQSYHFTDSEIHDLCSPTINEINQVLGMDYKKSLVFLTGFHLDEKNVESSNFENCVKALMIDKRMIFDPFIRKKIWNMISKRIEMAKRGAIRIYANFAMISGDPYALCQSIFDLEITGLLRAGEVYHKYWIDKGSNEIVCFRAPMTCHNNIRKMKLAKNDEVNYWYRFIDTALIYNAFDTACDAMNGADKDGDTNMCTDNEILIRNTLNSPTIMCVQRKAEKKIVTEEDIVKANKLAFNDDIGIVTNHVTSMIERQSGFSPDSEEYKVLDYRIMCGQLYQQNTIDRAKGIIAKPMPVYWYSVRDNLPKDDDTPEMSSKKRFCLTIVADKKPYFMTNVYPELKSRYTKYMKNNNYDSIIKFGVTLDELLAMDSDDPKVKKFIEFYHRGIPTGNNPCVVNRICEEAEEKFGSFSQIRNECRHFDYTILKSGAQYSKNTYKRIYELYVDFNHQVDNYQKRCRTEKIDKDNYAANYERLKEYFKAECDKVCPNELEQCEIMLDICYKTEKSKQFVWDMCGDRIIQNLLDKNGGKIQYPKEDEAGDFEYSGRTFSLCSKVIE